MLGRSLGYLIPALLGSVLLGGGVALWAVLQPRIGRFLDTLHVAMLGVPDFFMIVMLQFGAIFIDRQAERTVVMVMQFAGEAPFLIPFLAIMIMPALVIYGTLRIAFAREWDEGYIKTAFMKGLSRKSVVLWHIFRNTFEDFLSVFPRAVSVALATMVVVEVMTGIVGIGGYAINTSVVFTDALPTTCAILAIFAVLTNVVVSFVRKRYVVNTKEGA
jgi:ABC-type dipeptide/oligopeptide/nickel transport system permease component